MVVPGKADIGTIAGNEPEAVVKPGGRKSLAELVEQERKCLGKQFGALLDELRGFLRALL